MSKSKSNPWKLIRIDERDRDVHWQMLNLPEGCLYAILSAFNAFLGHFYISHEYSGILDLIYELRYWNISGVTYEKTDYGYLVNLIMSHFKYKYVDE